MLLAGPRPDVNVDEMRQLRRLFIEQWFEEPLNATGWVPGIPEYLPHTASANEVLSIQSRQGLPSGHCHIVPQLAHSPLEELRPEPRDFRNLDQWKPKRYSRNVSEVLQPNVGPSASSSRNTRILITAVFGAAGGLVGAILGELQFAGDEYRVFPENIHLGAGVWFMLAMVGVSLALAATESALQRNAEKLSAHLPLALAAGLGGGFIAGMIAQFVYGEVIGQDSPRLARVVGWAIAGALGGLAVGLSFRSNTRLRNGALGGLGGGAFGGFLFDPIAESIGGDSAIGARIVALIAIGAAIGLLMGLLDAASTSYSIEVLSREGAPRVIPLFDAVSIVGCARNVAVTVTRDPLIKEHHVRLTRTPHGLQVDALPGVQGFSLNGTPTTSGLATNGSIVVVGNTTLRVVGKAGGPALLTQQPPGHQAHPYGQPAATSPAPDTRRAPAAPPPQAARPTIQMKPKK